MTRLGFISLMILLGASTALSQHAGHSNKQVPQSMEKSAQTELAAILNINNFTFWQQGQGRGGYSPINTPDGGVFPRGTRWVIFADGFLWGGKMYLDSALTQPALPQLIRVGGNGYNVGNEIGWIEGTGPNAVKIGYTDPRARIYRIRRDWTEMSQDELVQDASENFLTPMIAITPLDVAAIKAQYARDWLEWPVAHGAPYIERNGISGYQQPPPFSSEFTVDSLISGNYDEPGIAGAENDYPADQVIWTAFNDLNRGNMIGLYGSEPIGLEMQLTLWGYKPTGALQNLFFKRLRIINKGGADVGGGAKGYHYVDSMFVGLWADPDLGQFGDDLLGCDTLLNIGFVYNGRAEDLEFAKFFLPPPAVGYTLLAGPMVKGSVLDTAIHEFRKLPGYRNHPMTSFWPKSTGSAFGDPPWSYEGSLRWWRAFNGFVPDPSTTPWRLYPAPPGENPTKFPLAGDPVTQTGFIDGLGTSYSFAPGDRRFLMSSGPFRLLPGDTQTVHLAVVGGLGSDRLSSITVMKANASIAHLAFQSLLSYPRAPRTPTLKVIQLDGQIILDWGSNADAVRSTESSLIGGVYSFEGYNVYQFPTAQGGKEDAVLVATFDRKNDIKSILDQEFVPEAGTFLPVVLHRGTDSGIRRSLSLTRDTFSGDLLRNGTEYFFAVTAYNYSPSISPRSLESDLRIIRVKPQISSRVAGYLSYGDSLDPVHTQGSGAGSVKATIINPLASMGDTYEISFDSNLLWSLQNVTRGVSLLTSQPLHTGPDDPPIVEGGIMLKVSGAHTAADVYRYSTVRLDSSLAVQQQSVERINVFPNPATAESYVTFNNLPQKAILTIYNLAGHRVRTLRKDDQSQFFAWDLRNEHNRQVGSGVYLCSIEMPDLGKTRLLKLAVIQPQLYPNLR